MNSGSSLMDICIIYRMKVCFQAYIIYMQAAETVTDYTSKQVFRHRTITEIEGSIYV